MIQVDAPAEQLDIYLVGSRLAWSFNRDGEAKAGLVERRDRLLSIDSASKRDSRRDLLQMAKPQGAVDAIATKFPGPTKPLPGVSDEANAA